MNVTLHCEVQVGFREGRGLRSDEAPEKQLYSFLRGLTNCVRMHVLGKQAMCVIKIRAWTVGE